MENYKRTEKENASKTYDHYLKRINEEIVIPEVLKSKTRNGGYVCWPAKRSFASKTNNDKKQMN